MGGSYYIAFFTSLICWVFISQRILISSCIETASVNQLFVDGAVSLRRRTQPWKDYTFLRDCYAGHGIAQFVNGFPLPLSRLVTVLISPSIFASVSSIS